MALHLLAHQSVVALQQRPPGTVAQLSGTLGRADDVGEQHRGEHAVAYDRSSRPRQEVLDLIGQGVRLAKGIPSPGTSTYRAFGMCWATYREWRTSR